MASTSASAEAGDLSLAEVPRCPLCGEARYRTMFEERPYSVRRCVGCELAWVTPRRDERALAALYASERYWRSPSPKTLGYSDYRGDQRLYVKTFRRRLRFALRCVPAGGRALDVGCAAGFCMQALSERGFEAYGVEVSAPIARAAREHFGDERVHVGTLASAPYPPRWFDVITMWDVVEHVVDPVALLRKARDLLRPAGLLVLETQNVDSAFARLLGRRWHHYKHAEHIQHFNPTSVDVLLRASGFARQALTPRFAGKYVSPGFLAERAGRLHPALAASLRPLALLRGVSVYVNVLDEMVVLARPA